MTRRELLSLGLAHLVLPAACHEPELPAVAYAGDFYELATAEDVGTLCGGTLDYSDGHTGHLVEALGDGSGRTPLRLHWVPVEEEYATWCPEDSSGCITESGAAVSRWPIHQHELVHLLRGRTYRPLSEGVAEFFGDDLNRVPQPNARVEDLLASPAPPPGNTYVRLAHFASFLATVHGKDDLLGFEAASTDDASWSDLDQTALEELGGALSEAVSEYGDSYPDCHKFQFRANEYECGSEAVQLDPDEGSVWESELPFSCETPGVVGPRLDKMWRYEVVEVQRAGAYRIYADHTTEATSQDMVRVARCGGSCLDAAGTVVGEQFIFGEILCWAPGRYLFRFSSAADRVSSIRLRIETLGQGTCAE